MGTTTSAAPAPDVAPPPGAANAPAYSFEAGADPAGAGKAAAQSAGIYQFDDGKGDGSAEPGEKPKTTGFLPNIWAGVHEGVASLNQNSESQPWQIAGKAADQYFGTHVTPSMSEDIQNLPAVKDVEPADSVEGAARAIARGVTATLGGWSVGRLLPEAKILTMGSPVRAAAVGATSAATGAILADWVPEQWRDVADAAGQLAGGIGALGIEGAARKGYQMASGAASTAAGPASMKTGQPLVDPASNQPFEAPGSTPTSPIYYPGTDKQAAIAGRNLATAGGMTPEEMVQNTPVGPWGGAMPTEIPGSNLTWGQSSGNTGVLSLENKLRTMPAGREQMAVQEAQNQVARVRNLENVQPQVAADAASQWALAKLQSMQAVEEQANAAGQATASGALERSGVTSDLPTEEAIGGTQRDALEALRVPAKESAGAALDAIDPHGDLALDTTTVADKAREISGGVGKGGRLIEDEKPVFDDAQTMRGVVPFQQLRELMSNTTEAMRTIGQDPKKGTESKPYRRLTELLRTIHDSIGAAAGRAAAREAAGGTSPAGGILDRFGQVDGEHGPTGTGEPSPTVAGQSAAGGTHGAAGEGGNQVSAAGGSGSSAGDSGVAAATATGQPGSLARTGEPPATPLGGKAARPVDAVTALIDKGGLKDPNGELAGRDPDQERHRFRGEFLGKLVNKDTGMDPNEARQFLRDNGYLSTDEGNDEGIAAKLAEEHLAGNPRYRAADATEAREFEQADRDQRRTTEARQAATAEVTDAERSMGHRLTQDEINHAVDLRMQGEHPEEAIRQAAYASEERGLQQNAQLNAFENRPGVSPAAQQSEMPVAGHNGGPPLVENMTPEAREAQRAANQEYAIYKDRFRTGAVGDVLKSGAIAGTFKLGDVRVPGALWRPGAMGGQAAVSLIKAAGSQEAALRIVGDAPYLSFRNFAVRDGVVNPQLARQWMARYAQTLDKFPEIRARLETPVAAQQVVEEAAIRGADRVKAYQDSAAKLYLGKNAEGTDPHVAIERLMGSENPAALARDLMRQAGPNNAAVDGIRRNTIEWFTNKITGTAEAGTTGDNALANGAFQRLMNNPKINAGLREVLTPDQMRALEATGEDLQKAARAWNAIKVQGTSQTAADTLAMGHGAHNPTIWFQLWLAEKAAHVANFALGSVIGPLGELVGIGAGKMYMARRAAGMATVNDLMTGGVLNPALRRVLGQKAVANPRAPIWNDVARHIVALGAGVRNLPRDGQDQNQ